MMPPAKRKAEQPPAAAALPGRVTRSAARLAAAGSVLPEKKETKKVETKKRKRESKKAKGKEKKKNEEIDEDEEGSVTVETDQGSVVDTSTSSKTLIIEHCKQCNAFKTRANMVKETLEKRTLGITVILNPEQPRRGCFEIRDEGGRKFISLLNMKRPFKPMKDLDMDKVISDIIDQI